MTHILAIDQGTTSSRAILFDQHLNAVDMESIPVTQYFPHEGWVEHDPEELFQGVLATAQSVITRNDALIEGELLVGITNQRETAIVWDVYTGQPVYPAIVWQSRQTIDICQDLRVRGLAQVVREKTGLVIDSYFSASKWRFILDAIPDGQDRADRGELLFGTVDSWLIWRLTGGKHFTDQTNASRTMVWNIHNEDWDEELLRELDLPRQCFPEVLTSGGLFGSIPESILGRRATIRAVAGDQQAALFGHGCFSQGQAKNTYGTGSFILAIAGDTQPELLDGIITTVAASSSRQKKQYVLEGSIFSAGSTVQWLRDQLGFFEEAAETAEIASALDDSGGVVMIPGFTGLGSPHWDEEVRGAFLGINRDTNKFHLIRAGLEAIAHQTSDVIDTFVRAGYEISELRVDGGAAANDWLMQFQANILDIPILRAEFLENTARGVAGIAGVEAGIIDSDVMSSRPGGTIFTNEIDPETRRISRERWAHALKTVREFK